MIIGIVGAQENKFWEEERARAYQVIAKILTESRATGMCSGHCPHGGVDIWAETIATMLKIPLIIFPPKELNWNFGYKPRNIQIAHTADIVHVVTPASKNLCRHCTALHVANGGCWTANFAQKKLHKKAIWHVV